MIVHKLTSAIRKDLRRVFWMLWLHSLCLAAIPVSFYYVDPSPFSRWLGAACFVVIAISFVINCVRVRLWRRTLRDIEDARHG